MKIAALSISSKIPVLSLSSVKRELLYTTMASEGWTVITFLPLTWKNKFQITNHWCSFYFSTTHPSELLMFTKTCDCTLPVFKWPGGHCHQTSWTARSWLVCWWEGSCFMSSPSCSLQIPSDDVFVPLTDSTGNCLILWWRFKETP